MCRRRPSMSWCYFLFLLQLRFFSLQATFFLNSDKMFDRDREDGRWKREEGQRMLVRLVEEGHVIADHSYGHMFHNENKGNVGVYLDVEEDAR